MGLKREVDEFYTHYCINVMDSSYKKKWENLAKNAKEKLDGGTVRNYTLFTPHDFSNHCFDIYDAVSRCVLNENAFKELPAEALFLLNVAVLYHDISMSVSPTTAIRNRHSRLSAAEFMNNEVCRENLSENQRQICAAIIYAHSDINEDTDGEGLITKVLDSEGLKDTFGDSCKEIPVKFLSGVLRMADELDVTRNRVRGTNMQSIEAVQPENADDTKEILSIKTSKEYWRKLMCFSGITCTNGTIRLKIIFDTYKDNPDEVSRFIREILKKIDKEMHEITTKCFLGDFFQYIRCNSVDVDFGHYAKGDDKEGFNNREAVFYRKLAPFILENYFSAKYPEIFKQLAVNQFNNTHLPFIKLKCDDMPMRVSSEIIRTERGKPKDNTTLDDTLINIKKKQAGKDSNRFYDGPKFMLERIDPEGVIRLSETSYYHIISTADSCRENFIRNFPVEWFYKEFEIRDFEDSLINHIVKKWFSLIREVLNNDFKGFCAGIGISTFVVFKSNNGYQYLLMVGSEKKATGGGMFHVIPSSMFEQAEQESTDDDKKIRLQVLREFGEEVLGITELKSLPTAKKLKEYCAVDERFKYLYKHFYVTSNNSEVDFHFKNVDIEYAQTGFILDIWFMRPAITNVLIIDKNDYFYPNGNEKIEVKTFEGKAINTYDLNDSNTYKELLEEIKFIPEGLSAFISGMEYMSKRS